ncbi:MAG: hypothetical protein AAF939_12720 [Planctomycetota bacterium]
MGQQVDKNKTSSADKDGSTPDPDPTVKRPVLFGVAFALLLGWIAYLAYVAWLVIGY